MSDVEGFESGAADAAERIRNAGSALVIAHIDADGITAASIASIALQREGIDHEVKFIKKLDPPMLQSVLDEKYDVLWFVDLGSGMYSKMDERCIVADHHRPDSHGTREACKSSFVRH